ncbi:MAG: protein kinase [Gemmatimonadaceae bacterium]
MARFGPGAWGTCAHLSTGSPLAESPITNIQNLSTALADRYAVERQIGAGGMATVYLARDLKHDRNVAIKVLRPEIGEALGAERFLLEIKTTANLRHPHIVPLYDSGEVRIETAGERAQTLLYYVMPLLEGESLRERLDRDKQLPIDDALRIASEVADALSYAHARGVVHRDIKPENIMLESGHAVVADFGIARAVRAAGGARLTGTGMSIGTPSYMSPEQAAGESDIDGRSDLYSLACVLYEMLGGQPPFSGANAATITRQHMIAVPPPITNLRPSVPAQVADALQRALSKSPADRFNPVAQFGAAIAPGAITASAVAGNSTRTVSSANPGGAQRYVVVGIAVAAIALVAAVWYRSASNAAGASASSTSATSSIAVLPFTDLSPDHANAYLGDGVAETLINALVHVPGLTVTARTSAFSFRGRESDVKEIGKQLHVDAVLEGSIQRVGDKLRITAQLINTSTGVNLWSNSFDRPVSDIFAMQDEVARSAVDALKLRIKPGSDSGAVMVGTRNAEAYNAYLLGRFHWNLRTTEGMIQATAALKHAVALDSMYALAWAALGDAYMLSVPTEYNVPGLSEDSLLALSMRAVRRAIAIDPKLGEAHISLANLLSGAKANAEFEEGLRLSPNYATGHQFYSYHLTTSDPNHATREMEIAHRLDPLSHVITLSVALLYDAADRFTEATPLFAQALTQSPEAWYGWGGKIGHEMALGHVDQAVFAYKRWLIGMHDDTTRALNLERDLRDSTRRSAAIKKMVKSRDMIPAVAFTRWLSGDDAVIALLTRNPTTGRGPTPFLIMYGMLGPRLRANPQVQTLLPKLR